jgi:hypothetical protein
MKDQRIRMDISLVFTIADEDDYRDRVRVITDSIRELEILLGGMVETDVHVSIVP